MRGIVYFKLQEVALRVQIASYFVVPDFTVYILNFCGF